MKITIRNAIAGAALALLLAPASGWAQSNIYDEPTGDWTTAANWNQGGIPDAVAGDADAVIGSTVGTGVPIAVVEVTTDLPATTTQTTPTVVLGNEAGTEGTLNISSSGVLHAETFAASDGNFVVGSSGLGILNVDTGGTLTIDDDLNSGGDAGSSITIAGTGSVSANTGFLDRNLEIDSTASLSFTSGVIFGLAGTNTFNLPSSGLATAPISVGGNADLGGTLVVSFSGGTPSAGATWNLVDAATVDDGEAIPSGFTGVDTSSVSGLGSGERFATETVAGGTNGTLAQLKIEQHPVLIVNRDTGAVTISNPSGAVDSIAIDAYAITSAIGALDDSAWTSLEDSGAAAGTWLEANPSANAISELNPTSSGDFAASSTTALGDIFDRPTPTAFGENNEDLRFRYAKPGGGFIEGDIVYEGLPNDTLTLNVDPDTGEAQIVNGTDFTVSIDAYVIRSASGSLLEADGDPADTWNSLEDQGTSGGLWFEANSDANLLSELLVSGGLELAPNATVSLGSPFDDASGLEDLEFEFAILGESADGDFNADGVVDAADYAVWRNNLGAGDDSSLNENGDGVAGVTAADYDVWRANYGNVITGSSDPALLSGKLLYSALVTPGAGSGQTIPEPGAAGLLLVGVWLVGGGRRGKRH